jgi:hypothetical protein
VRPFPEEVLRDPVERTLLMEQLRTQIVFKTRAVPEPRYRAVVRPQLTRQLLQAGFGPNDVQRLLSAVDQVRAAESR